MTVKDIIMEYLNTHGYDGLYDGQGECVCCLEDLIPCSCSEYCLECQPGYLQPGDEKFDFYIGPDKPDA